MKKLLSILSLCFLISMGAQAQYYFNTYNSPGQNPGGLNTSTEYPLGSGLPAGWSAILGPSVTTPAWSANQSIPFSFNFNGSAVTQYKVSSTGVLTFTTSATTVPGAKASLPSANVPDNSVCIWGVATTGTNDFVVTQTFGSAPNRQHWVFFTSHALGGTGWSYWSIVLEESTDNIYIVDQRHSGVTGGVSMGIQLNSSTAYSVGANVLPIAGTDPTPADNAYYEFIQGSRLAIDAELSDITTPQLVLLNSNVSIDGIISNKGSTTLTSAVVNWSINQGAVNKDTVNLNLATSASQSFSHQVNWVPTIGGANDLKVWLTEPNFQTDGDNSNDTLNKTIVGSNGNSVQKTALLEQFTTAVCQFCPDGAWVTAQIQNNYQNVEAVSVHSCFGTDAMTNTEASDLCSTLGIGAAPTAMVDRKLFPNETDVAFGRGQGYPNWQNSTWAQRALSQSNSGSAVDINLTGTYNSGTRSLNATINASFVDYIGAGDVRVSLMLIEDSVTGTGNGYNQINAYNTQTGHPFAGKGNPIVGYNHKRVMRDIWPSTWGDASVIPSNYALNTTYSKSFTQSIPANYDANQISLIAIVSYYGGSSVGEYEVLNIESVDLNNLVTSIPEQTNINESLTIYPNPSSFSTNLEFRLDENKVVNLRVLDITGKVMLSENYGSMAQGKQKLNLDLSGLSNGFYFINLNVGEEVISRKISISK